MSPHLSITSQWEQTTARHNVNWMRQLVPIGLSCASSVRTRRIVSRTGPGFSPALVATPQRVVESAPRRLWIRFRLGRTGELRLYSEPTFRRRYSHLQGEDRAHAR